VTTVAVALTATENPKGQMRVVRFRPCFVKSGKGRNANPHPSANASTFPPDLWGRQGGIFFRRGIIFLLFGNNYFMIKSNNTIAEIKAYIKEYYLKPVVVRLNLGRNKYVTFSATLTGIYPSLFTVTPDDKNFIGKTAYSYSEILCGRVEVCRTLNSNAQHK
jgi:uncharacterized protein Veg